MMLGEQSEKIKMFGYLEKRGKMTIRGRWKQRWCVLEGHLLLYYKSQAEYLKLSPCCGSLNVALVRKIQPNVRCLIHITTHSKLIILRSPSKEKQEAWFHALAGVLMQNNQGSLGNDFLFPNISSHRRPEVIQENFSQLSPLRLSFVQQEGKAEENLIDSKRRKERVNKNTEKDDQYSNNPSENPHSIQITISDVENKISEDQPKDTQDNTSINRCSSDSKILGLSMKQNLEDVKRSSSCNCISTFPNDTIEAPSNDLRDPKEKRTSKVTWNDTENGDVPFVEKPEQRSRRNSQKKRTKTNAVHSRSFGFLKKILTRKRSKRKEALQKQQQQQQHKVLPEIRNSFSTSIVGITATFGTKNSPEEEETYSLKSFHENIEISTLSEETVVSITKSNESIKIEDSESWTMIEKEVDRTSLDDVVPELPPKMRKNTQRYSWQKGDSFNTKAEIMDSYTLLNPNTELDQLMSQLTDLNKEPDFSYKPDKTHDYDIPRSHLSIISEMLSENADTENSSIGIPESRYDPLSALDMYPDSLEMPWLTDDTLNNNTYWPAACDDLLFKRGSIESDNDESFLDSLNTIKHLS